VNDTKRTLRERKFIEAYIGNGGNSTLAYLTINDKANKNTAGVLGSRMLRKVKIEVNNILEQIGLNDVYLAGKLKEGLESDDLNIRLRYLDIIFRLKGTYAPEKHGADLVLHKLIDIDMSKYPKQKGDKKY